MALGGAYYSPYGANFQKMDHQFKLDRQPDYFRGVIPEERPKRNAYSMYLNDTPTLYQQGYEPSKKPKMWIQDDDNGFVNEQESMMMLPMLTDKRSFFDLFLLDLDRIHHKDAAERTCHRVMYAVNTLFKNYPSPFGRARLFSSHLAFVDRLRVGATFPSLLFHLCGPAMYRAMNVNTVGEGGAPDVRMRTYSSLGNVITDVRTNPTDFILRTVGFDYVIGESSPNNRLCCLDKVCDYSEPCSLPATQQTMELAQDEENCRNPYVCGLDTSLDW